MRHLIDILDLSVEEIDALIKTATDIIAQPEKYQNRCNHRIMATLFYEPSTRTRLSFESAMQSLGGSVIGFASAESSSVAKGETVADTVRTVGCYADIIAMRHPLEGAPMAAAVKSFVPIINAGDGGHLHPTQTLTDLLTIVSEVGRLQDLTIGFCGDLKYGRTVHSLVSALCRYTGIKMVLISPEELKLPEYLKRGLMAEYATPWIETDSLEEALPILDVLYMTRVQKERFPDEEQYNRLKDTFVLDQEKLRFTKKELSIMHPLPRVNEIAAEIDDDPRAAYFKQMKYGKFIRMALILKLLSQESLEQNFVLPQEISIEQETCKNSVCITNHEAGLAKYIKQEGEIASCFYCEHEIR